MKGIVIVTHGSFGDVLIETSEMITGTRAEAITSVSINPEDNVDQLREKIARGIKSVSRKSKDGIIILTDMFGGTPSNLSYSFLEEGRVEVLSGVNLPILIKAINTRDKKPLSELAQILETFGKRSISLASGILKGNTRN